MRILILFSLAVTALSQQVVPQIGVNQQYVAPNAYFPYGVPGMQYPQYPFQYQHQYNNPYYQNGYQYPPYIQQSPAPYVPAVPPPQTLPPIVKEIEQVVDVALPVKLSAMEAAMLEMDRKKEGHSEKYYYGRSNIEKDTEPKKYTDSPKITEERSNKTPEDETPSNFAPTNEAGKTQERLKSNYVPGLAKEDVTPSNYAPTNGKTQERMKSNYVPSNVKEDVTPSNNAHKGIYGAPAVRRLRSQLPYTPSTYPSYNYPVEYPYQYQYQYYPYVLYPYYAPQGPSYVGITKTPEQIVPVLEVVEENINRPQRPFTVDKPSHFEYYTYH